MKRYQGEDIYFSLNFSTSTIPDITSFNDLENMIVYAYTQSDIVTKFSRIAKEGYGPLLDTNGNGLTLKGVISSDNTKDMLGQIVLDIMCIKSSTEGDLTENLIQKALTGIFIMPSVIKEEA